MVFSLVCDSASDDVLVQADGRRPEKDDSEERQDHERTENGHIPGGRSFGKAVISSRIPGIVTDLADHITGYKSPQNRCDPALQIRTS